MPQNPEVEKLKALMDGATGNGSPQTDYQRELIQARSMCEEIFSICESSGFAPQRASEILAMLAGILAARTSEGVDAAFIRGADLCKILLEAAVND